MNRMEKLPQQAQEAPQERADGIAEWLHEEAPYIGFDQKHIQEHTSERAYWHYGYMIACRDILRKWGAPSPPQENEE